VSQDETQTLLLRRVLPHYPQEAREERVQGSVVLKLTISPEGNARDVSLISGDPLLAPAAIGAVELWKYRPFMLNEQAIEVETQTVVNFKLETPEDPGEVSSPDLLPQAGSGIAGDAAGGIADDQLAGAGRAIISSAPATTYKIATLQRVRVSQRVSAGLLVKKVNPEYPLEARQGRIQGTVLLHVLISKAGDVAKLAVVSGDPLLAPAAIDAVKRWNYKLYLLNGNPVEGDTQILINFTLSGN
jgi:TonB family protein